jgi:hypothetical protein
MLNSERRLLHKYKSVRIFLVGIWTMFDELITHGFFAKAINKDCILILKKKIESYLAAKRYPTYVSAIDKEIPSVLDLLTQDLFAKIKEILQSSAIKLESVELHYLPTHSSPIPPHQDNFYHGIEGGEGLKILIPLVDFTPESGGLYFLDCPTKIGILRHIPSKVKNFSSYIEPQIFQNLGYQSTAYEYKIGDASYHLLNSVHFSRGNRSKHATMFLVFRFQSLWVRQSPHLLKNYRDVFQEYVRNLPN